MKTGRNILISAILALGAAGSIAPVVAAAAPAATHIAATSQANPNSFYHA